MLLLRIRVTAKENSCPSNFNSSGILARRQLSKQAFVEFQSLQITADAITLIKSLCAHLIKRRYTKNNARPMHIQHLTLRSHLL